MENASDAFKAKYSSDSSRKKASQRIGAARSSKRQIESRLKGAMKDQIDNMMLEMESSVPSEAMDIYSVDARAQSASNFTDSEVDGDYDANDDDDDDSDEEGISDSNGHVPEQSKPLPSDDEDCPASDDEDDLEQKT